MNTTSSQTSCVVCQGRRYQLARGVAHWEASLCDCMKPCNLCPEDEPGWVKSDKYSDEFEYQYTEYSRCPKCWRAKLIADRMTSAQFPSTYDTLAVTPKSAEQEQLFSFLRAWLKQYDERCTGWTLTGNPGAGKTHGAVMLGRALVEGGVMVRYVQQYSFLKSLRPPGGKGDLDALCRVPVLIYDELDTVRTDWQAEVVTDLFLERYQAGLTTLITTNLDEDDIETAFGDGHQAARIVSRLSEWAPLVPFNGPDLRRQG